MAKKNLTRKQVEFVQCFTDPTLPCYLSPTKAAIAAGFEKSHGSKLMNHEEFSHVQDAVQVVFDRRVEAGRDMLEIMHDSRLAAIDNLAKSIRVGQSLRMIDPEVEFGEGAANTHRVAMNPETGEVLEDSKGRPILVDESARFREINKHNTNVLKAMQEARLAAMDLLSYVLGKPEQVIRHKDDKLPSAEKIAALQDDDIDALIQAAERELNERAPVVEAILVEDVSSPSEDPEQ